MHDQLDLEVVSNLSKFERKPSNFHGYWSEKLGCKNNKIKNPLMYEYYNLMDPME